MIKLIIGHRGSGKTKTMVDMINTAAETASGDIICIEKGMKLTYDIKHSVRLVDMDEYFIEGYDTFLGFVSGMLAGNYDIECIYVDGILKIGEKDGVKDLEGFGLLLEKICKLELHGAKFVFTVSADEKELPESVKKYL